MNKPVLTIFASLMLSAAATTAVLAQGYAAPSSQRDPNYPPGGYPAESREAMTDFDQVDDDQAPQQRRYAAPQPQGPVMSPDDPRYGRPSGAPVYSDRGPPQGPVMSPDDPRYGRPDGPPAVIYSDRPGQPQRADRGYDDGRGLRPPEAIGGAQGGYVTGSVSPRQDGEAGRPVQLSALPPEEQPEAGPANLDPRFRRQEVSFATKEPAGTIVVDTPHTYLYYVLGNGRAVRYGIRVGRDGFRWAGVQKITRKTEWPDWHPPSEMIERQPYLPRFMAGGEGNPLGARAMYLGSTVYRIHGTNQPSTIGKTVSSGCFGMLNDDVTDLFERAKVGTRVVVLPGNPPASASVTAAAQPAPASGNYDPQAAPSPQAYNTPGTQPTAVQPLPAPVTVR